MSLVGCNSGARIWFELEEMGLRGWAYVQEVNECPPIQSGRGHVVLATVTHLNTSVMELRLAGQTEPLRPTGRHQLFSATRNHWVATSSLQTGELLLTAEGTVRISSLKPWSGVHRVFNIEVETDHSYFAGKAKVLSHNTCAHSPVPAANNVTTPVGELRAAKLKDAHHVIQDAAVRDLPGYNTSAAPGIQLEGPANIPGTPHNLTRPVQQQAGGGTYAAERRIGYKALRRAGVNKVDARQAISESDEYFQGIGVTPSTPTRIPGDRR